MRRPLNAKAYILRNPSVRTQPTVWSPQWGCKLEALCGWLRLCPGPQWPVGSGFSALETRLPARPWAVEGGVSLVNHKDGNSVRCGLWEEGPSAGSGDGRTRVSRASRSAATSGFTFQTTQQPSRSDSGVNAVRGVLHFEASYALCNIVQLSWLVLHCGICLLPGCTLVDIRKRLFYRNPAFLCPSCCSFGIVSEMELHGRRQYHLSAATWQETHWFFQ